MIRISKDFAEKLVEDVLISISKKEGMSPEFAKNSLDIMNNPIDNSVFTGILMSKITPSIMTNEEEDMKITVLASLQTIYGLGCDGRIDDFDFDNNLAKHFCPIDHTKCCDSLKLNFALNQFVNAFFEYERLEKTYPSLMKTM